MIQEILYDGKLDKTRQLPLTWRMSKKPKKKPAKSNNHVKSV